MQARPFHPLRFDGRVAVVTGAGRGLGREHALLLAERGADVVVNDIAMGPDGVEGGEWPARQVVAQIRERGGRAIASEHSVVDGADRIVAAAIAAFGRIDILVNNAGISGGGLFPDIPAAQWQRLLDIHLGGTVALCRAAWPHLKAGAQGRIVNTSSSAAMGSPYTAHYGTAKAALIGLTRTLAIEGAPWGITANAVMPSAFTRLTAQVPNEALRDFLENRFPAHKVAPFVAWLVHSRTTVSGETFTVGAGHAARVAFAVGPGAHAQEDTPEAWDAVMDSVMSMDGASHPASMIDELCLSLRRLGPQGHDMATALAQRAGKGPTAF